MEGEATTEKGHCKTSGAVGSKKEQSAGKDCVDGRVVAVASFIRTRAICGLGSLAFEGHEKMVWSTVPRYFNFISDRRMVTTVIQFFRGEIIRRYIPCTCVPQDPTGRHHRCSACPFLKKIQIRMSCTCITLVMTFNYFLYTCPMDQRLLLIPGILVAKQFYRHW